MCPGVDEFKADAAARAAPGGGSGTAGDTIQHVRRGKARMRDLYVYRVKITEVMSFRLHEIATVIMYLCCI